MDFAAARCNMVESQIRTNRISDPRLIAALEAIPREPFLPRQLRGLAYLDEDIPIGGGRVMVEPLVLARLLQGAGVRPADVVLAIGDATGWAGAVLSRLASTVVLLECDSDLANRGGAALAEMGCDTVAVVKGALADGYAAQAPYDAIVFVGAVSEIPAGIVRQLADGGRLVAVVSGGAGGGRVTLVVRSGDSFGRRTLFDAATPFLPGLEPPPRFGL
ncbi:protein-L-isoaspartate O-methyltransferase [Magnetospirillum sp. SS-4]|uniref:protein-L-isoaspartate O-methyltransferase family protein n=1 Tax=Magnetospirillum sp. SS-4 TaxID=2681465 RepID=UPI001385F52F|nr:protein-L-isoaspartate O-methyltransferase [Magnetospirillum sp. SS-4]CAA7620268.1 Protein-L-isoaspartate O-methyltransferase [Magnetospirillum sp. SS-4]